MSMSVDAAGSSTLDPYQSSGQGNTQALQQLAQLEQLIQQLIAELQMFSQLNNLAKQNSSPSVGGAGGGGGGGGGMPALSDGGGGGAPQTLAAAPGGAPAAADASPATGSGAPADSTGAPATAGASSVQATPDASGGDMTPQEVASKYKDEIMSASQSTGVPPGIIAGQIWQESKGIANTPGGGLMQLGPNEFQQYGGGDISNPADNIRAGANYMKDLANQFGGNMGAALRAYNSGPNGVDLGNLNATPAGTGDPTYVQKVMQAAQQSGLATA